MLAIIIQLNYYYYYYYEEEQTLDDTKNPKSSKSSPISLESNITLPQFKVKFAEIYEKMIPKSRQDLSYKDLKKTNSDDISKLNSINIIF